MIESAQMQCPICKVPIDSHKASACLDAWVAEKILEREVKWVEDSMGSKRPDAPSFSTDIASAWLIMQKVRVKYSDHIDLVFREGQFGVRLSPTMDFTWCDQEPLAICRAAIKTAVMRPTEIPKKYHHSAHS